MRSRTRVRERQLQPVCIAPKLMLAIHPAFCRAFRCAGSGKIKGPSKAAEAAQGLCPWPARQERAGPLTVPDQRLLKSEASLNNCQMAEAASL